MNPLSNFSDDVVEINISHQHIKGVLDFSRFTKLEEIDCAFNKITSLRNLPNTLKKLYCIYNKIKKLNNLPNSLEILNCRGQRNNIILFNNYYLFLFVNR